ncbi:VQ motif [Musa troglodytarum]|uniref:VQ motif n=1 Tax=Musa troglodytarum TaxID=320322 RepID=A0A9E7KRP0_9LILI|nr:VQ motif [Musa troglodytarum]
MLCWSQSMENHQIQSSYPIMPHSTTSTSCISNNGVTTATPLPTPPPTPKSTSRCMDATPCATTFVQANTSSFKQVVQLYIGSIKTMAKCYGGLPLAAKAITTPKRWAFKPYERRSNLKTISPLKSSAFLPRKQPSEIMSPSVLDFPLLALSAVTPMTLDPFNRLLHPYSIVEMLANACSITAGEQ